MKTKSFLFLVSIVSFAIRYKCDWNNNNKKKWCDDSYILVVDGFINLNKSLFKKKKVRVNKTNESSSSSCMKVYLKKKEKNSH